MSDDTEMGDVSLNDLGASQQQIISLPFKLKYAVKGLVESDKFNTEINDMSKIYSEGALKYLKHETDYTIEELYEEGVKLAE